MSGTPNIPDLARLDALRDVPREFEIRYCPEYGDEIKAGPFVVIWDAKHELHVDVPVRSISSALISGAVRSLRNHRKHKGIAA